MLLAVFADVLVHMGFYHYESGRYDFQALADVLADVAHLPLALEADALVFCQDLVGDFDLNVFRQLLLGSAPCLAGTRLYNDLFNRRFGRTFLGEALRLVEQVAQLDRAILRLALFTGWAEALFARQANLLDKPIDLLLKGSDLGG